MSAARAPMREMTMAAEAAQSKRAPKATDGDGIVGLGGGCKGGWSGGMGGGEGGAGGGLGGCTE